MKIDADTPWRQLLRLLDRDLTNRHQGEKSTLEASKAWQEVGRRVHLYARAITRTRAGLNDQDSEDLAAGVMLQLQDQRLVRRMIRVGVPAGYLHAILRNAAGDLWKRRRFQQSPLEEARVMDLPQQATDAGSARMALVLSLRAEMALLSEDERQLLLLRFERRLKLREIAAELDIGFSAAAVRLHRLIKKLKGRMGME